MNRAQALTALESTRLYGILDTGYSNPGDWPQLAAEFAQGGVGLLQVRAKQASPEEILHWARSVHPVTEAAGIPLIINDYPELVPPSGAEGCHIGQDGGSLERARRLAGPSALIGRSTHSLEQALTAQSEGFDYIGFGPIFPTPTKPGRPAIGMESLVTLNEVIQLPAFCIGGIKRDNLESLISRRVKRVVIVSGLIQAEDIPAYARQVVCRLGSVT